MTEDEKIIKLQTKTLQGKQQIKVHFLRSCLLGRTFEHSATDFIKPYRSPVHLLPGFRQGFMKRTVLVYVQ